MDSQPQQPRSSRFMLFDSRTQRDVLWARATNWLTSSGFHSTIGSVFFLFLFFFSARVVFDESCNLDERWSLGLRNGHCTLLILIRIANEPNSKNRTCAHHTIANSFMQHSCFWFWLKDYFLIRPFCEISIGLLNLANERYILL